MQTIKYIKKDGQYIGEGDKLYFNKEDTIIDLFEKQVQKSPNEIAIRFNDLVLTYAQLSCRINQMSNHLESLNISSHSSIALYLNPGIEMIVTIISILKSGFYFIPIDVTYPNERVNFMLKDSNCSLIITENNIKYKLSNTYTNVLNLDSISSEIDMHSESYSCKAQSSNLAYMIYTSGSTGVPKGVQITHMAVINHMTWMSHQFKFDGSDKILFKTPLSFDPSIWEVLIPLLNGSELVISPAGSHIDPELLIDLVLDNKITIIQMVPSILKLFLNSKRIEKCESLRKVYVGGESLRPEVKKLFFKKLNCQLINLYGPTEATIDITFHEVISSSPDINTNIIGKPISNTSIYIVNEDGNLATIGEDGEILIGSLSLSKGYCNRDSLTNECFIKNLFEPKKFKILYKTGDLARWLPSGELEYLGRNNDQVKINGVRIEPIVKTTEEL
jgi:amino acid adenylation domain-containing protein